MLFTLKRFKTSVNTDSKDSTRSCQTIRLLCRNSTGFCEQLGQRVDKGVTLEKEERERAIVSRPQDSCVDVMPVRHRLRQRYYERQYLCPILWRVLVFVMLPRYCLSLAGKSCPIETVLLSIITLLWVEDCLLLYNIGFIAMDF